jgi:hypothetical protein
MNAQAVEHVAVRDVVGKAAQREKLWAVAGGEGWPLWEVQQAVPEAIARRSCG